MTCPGFLTIPVLIFLVSLLICFPAEGEEKLVLVQGGKARAKILVGPQASRVERFAASELQKYLKQISGAELSISEGGQAGSDASILIGKAEANPSLQTLARKGKIELSADYPGKEGFILKTLPEALVIGGSDDLGVLYGVYALLEDELGCCWVAPGEDEVPNVQTIALLDLNRAEKPDTRYRALGYVSGDFERVDWAAKLRLNYVYDYLGYIKFLLYGGEKTEKDLGEAERRVKGLTEEAGKRGLHIHWGAHCYGFWLPPEKYFGEHPEYYSLIDGKRYANETMHNWQYCISNQEVAQVVADNICRFFQENPAVETVALDPNDGSGDCQCQECRKLQREAGMNLYLYFADKVARMVAKKCPGKIISFDCNYHPGRCTPPENYRLADNLVYLNGFLNRSYGHPIYDKRIASSYQRNYQFLMAWAKDYADKQWIWCIHYQIYGTRGILMPMYRVIQQDWKHLTEDVGIWGGCSVAGWDWAEWVFFRYIFAKATWDNDVDMAKVLDRYCQGAFGQAAKPMRRFLQILDQSMQEVQKEGKLYDNKYFDLPRLLDSKEMKELGDLLNEAESLAQKEAVKERIARWKKQYDFTKRHWAQSYTGADLVPKGIKGPFVAYDGIQKLIILVGPHTLQSIRDFLDKEMGIGQTVFREYEPGHWVCQGSLALGNPVEATMSSLVVEPGKGTEKVSLTIEGNLTVGDHTRLVVKDGDLRMKGFFSVGLDQQQIKKETGAWGPGDAQISLDNCHIETNGLWTINGGAKLDCSDCEVVALRVNIDRCSSLPSEIRNTKFTTRQAVRIGDREADEEKRSRLVLQGCEFLGTENHPGLFLYLKKGWLGLSIKDCAIKGSGHPPNPRLACDLVLDGKRVVQSLTNCRYDTLALGGEGAVLVRKWHLDLVAKKADGVPIAGGKVICESSLGDKYGAEATTDKMGRCRLEVIAYRQRPEGPEKSVNRILILYDGTKKVIRENWTPSGNSEYQWIEE